MEGSSLITTEYAGNYIYENGVLQFFNHAEGYAEPVSTGSTAFKYIYQYKDHLGNIRLSYKDVSTTSTPVLQILEENNYYPFGLKHKGYNNTQNGRDHKYGYNGKEEQDEFNGSLQWLDFGARNYESSIGLFHSLDLKSEEYEFQSPYVYAGNDPVRFIDVNGKGPGDVVVVFGGGHPNPFTKAEPGGLGDIAAKAAQLFEQQGGGVARAFASPIFSTKSISTQTFVNGTGLSSNVQTVSVNGISPKTLDELTQEAFEFVVENFNKHNGESVTGGRIVIAGFSLGGTLALHLARRLQAAGFFVDHLNILDAAYGSNSEEVDRTVDLEKTGNVINRFQQNKMNFFGFRNTENFLGSFGDLVTSKDGKVDSEKVKNIKVSVNHQEIDNEFKAEVIQEILNILKKKKKNENN